MKRRSKVSGEQIKRRRRKTPEPERVNAPKGQARSKLPPPAEETEVARLTRELSDERRQRTATSEVLGLLSGSHGDLNRLFDTHSGKRHEHLSGQLRNNVTLRRRRLPHCGDA